MKAPQTPPALQDLFDLNDAEKLVRVLSAGIRATVDGKYRHWDNVRQLSPPQGLSLQDWWLGIKLARMGMSRELPITDTSGRRFTYTTPDEASEALHDIDQRASGTITVSEIVTTESAQRRYLVDSLIEESISSSQLEGASTTKRVAKEMIRAGREPRDRSERMIFNNFHAMNLVREWTGEPMSLEKLLELHRLVTDGTLDDPAAAGRIQTIEDERVAVTDRATGEVTHEPPPAEQLNERLEQMLGWANGGGSRGFVHPVLRSIVLHLWLAYDHPFEDGNGRTARALFYWSMLSQGYWLTEWLSISSILTKAPAKYARSFLLTETDDLDATYFILYQLSVIRRAIDELHAYLRRKMSEVRDTERLLQSSDLNYRQIALVGNALRHADASFTYKSHSMSHRVALESARLDLLDLEKRGLLTKRKVGRQMVFHPVPNLADLLADGAPAPV
jgi:Fic family protein